MMKANHPLRIARTQKILKARSNDGTSAVLISSNPVVLNSRDGTFPYRPNSDLFYLTGSKDKELSLLVSSNLPRPILFADKPDPVKILWDGAGVNPRTIAKRIGADLVVSSNQRAEILKKLEGVETLFHQNTPNTMSWRVAQSLLERGAHLGGKLPRSFGNSELLIGKLRLYKDPSEVAAIREAAVITNAGLYAALSVLRTGYTECDVAAVLEFVFRSNGAVPAFGTIVGCGVNGATLHYDRCSDKLKAGEMVLIDCGAQLDLYNADITRVVPVNGKFEKIHAVVYDGVLRAQRAAIKAVKAGVMMQTVYDAGARELIETLRELRVLSGSTAALLKKGKHKPYFPHGIGHTLGIDVHDVGELRGNNACPLEEGMVITIEPGLYFPKAVGKAPRCGVRIEDDVLVTKKGGVVLTDGFPKDRKEIEELF